ncbi:MAG: ammonia-forming cytochrome c nitrite reductase subunit c552, partial [Deferribacterales bacterium]
MKKVLMLVLSLLLVVFSGSVFAKTTAKSASGATPDYMKVVSKGVDYNKCYECHDTIKELRGMGKHSKLACENCHGNIEAHLKEPTNHPTVYTEWQACGKCHKEQFESFMHVSKHRPARDEKSQLTNRAPNPFWDKLMMGHGFTKEHALTRSHPFALLDQVLVDRAAGGRFQPKNGWMYVNEGPKKIWDVIVDTQPGSDHKVFMKQTAAAVNPVCFQCKTQDHILDWAYLGDPNVGAPFSRKSNPTAMIQSKKLQHAMNCYICHDPHAAKPRVVRDGLIAALTRPKADTLWHKDPNHTNIKVIDMGMRGYTRKIAILDKYDTRLQCGQCHVEYVCNPGSERTTGKAVGYDSPLTNHFPYKDVLSMYDHYVNQLNFTDYVHPLTGAKLVKFQHPESETYYNSKHAKVGAGCDTCHMPKVQDKKTKKVYTYHNAVTPKHDIKASCLTAKCHSNWTEEDAKYAIDSVKAYIKGKMRKAEFWLSTLIDKIVEGKNADLPADVIAKAQDYHVKAHILWEWWTAENSDGFHNPTMARESLAQSIDASMAGVKLIDDALKAK